MKQTRKYFSLLLILCLICPFFGMTACKTQEKKDGTVPITDDLGRTVSVPQSPRRVVALLGSFADIWVLSGGTLSAAPVDAWEDFGHSLENAVNLGGAHSPNAELLLASAPDLVLASASSTSNLALQSLLESAGIAVLYFDVDNFEDYLHMLDVCTDLTGRKDLYTQNGLQVQRAIQTVKEDFAKQQIPQEERKILLLRVSSTTVKAKGSAGTILGEILCDMGCVNLADNNKNLLETLSVEQILAEQPYRIFAVTMGNDPAAAQAALENLLRENPAWASLSAVRENRVHVMNKQLFNLKPNARWAEAYGVVYEILTK